MAVQRRNIDHLTKFLVREGLAPKEVLQSLHKSQISRYRSHRPEHWSGYELAALSRSHLSLLRDFNEDHTAQTVFKAYKKVAMVLTAIIASLNGFRKEMRSSREQIVHCVEEARKSIGLSNALELLHISKTTYHGWLAEVKSQCLDSPFRLCQKRFCGQLATQEIKAMEALLMDQRFFYWPIASLHLYALRKGLLSASLSTWYKYNRVLGIRRPKPISRRKKRKKGVRAARPNEIWHTDITQVELASSQIMRLYLLVDNFSRKIINWRLEEKVSARISLDMIQESFQKVLGGLSHSITLISDGGPENSLSLQGLGRRSAAQILRILALKDINFSNSIVEAINKMIKNGFLNHFEITSTAYLRKLIERFIREYNQVRPHGSLMGLTPDEAYKGLKDLNSQFRMQVQQAKIARVAANRKTSCGHCL